ncbi:Peptidyl-prolyl cis-trans isomerase cyp10 [Naganishia adeliensis]|uniref:Peptidyl-prolyl cis-trans isomerase cyp10 n=1 Tax=Naganishia adeliensis TaxID=92952 RepID=A0ACC2VXL0_9TREE|nr:Peptidyl-prolyl cis-trans isomerase cyp10 [Naganishia adeliensis]
MIQTGDPTGTGKGGQSIYGQPFEDEIRPTLKFFITYGKQPSLDGKYTIFGKVIDGVDSTLDAMEKVPVNPKHRPLQEIKLLSVTIHANPLADAQE